MTAIPVVETDLTLMESFQGLGQFILGYDAMTTGRSDGQLAGTVDSDIGSMPSSFVAPVKYTRPGA